MSSSPSPIDPQRARSWVYAMHVGLCVCLSGWRAIEATPGLSSTTGGTFGTSTLGRALTVVSILGGVAALIGIAALTWRMRRDLRLDLLFVALALAITRRGGIDAFDIAYVVLVALLAVVHFYTSTAREPRRSS